MPKFTKEEIASAYESLKRLLKAGDTINCVLRHVASNGMSRRISFYVAVKGKYSGKPEVVCIDHLIIKVLGYRRHESSGAVVVGGCGMDMGFAVVYNLGRAMFPKGYKVTKNSNNGYQNIGQKQDGGYAFQARWM